ncbi:DNA (cytosine-5-)-methyltransferase [Streptomyces brasiliscabiei]|uniref:DNA (cytosine-5-)-methyltransferase n=1 Tax=Streptomyces brasiliscabiei TaxID=2736302 RepID=A0ABU8GG57_9ACTN
MYPSRSEPLIGSLCSGYGGLDLGVQAALGGTLAWHAEINPDAARILARHWPGVPNLGDITAVDWAQVPRVCVLTAGFPCQDVSVAGRRAGLAEGTRSGLWHHIAHAISVLDPCLVVIENVRGLLSASAGPPGDLEPCPWCLGDAPGQPVVRALGAVLGSLADLGFDARWRVLRASDVGAPHRRERVFLTAWPARRSPAAEDPDEQSRLQRGLPAPGQEEAGRARAEPGRRGGASAPADSEGVGRDQGLAEPAARQRRSHSALGSSLLAGGAEGLRHQRVRPESPSSVVSGGAAAVERSGDPAAVIRWGPYAAAIARWESLTRPAPRPTDDAGRLNPAFVEWMQGLPDGWVTATPGLGRPAQLTALGNGVVLQQAARALELLAPPFPACPRCRTR